MVGSIWERVELAREFGEKPKLPPQLSWLSTIQKPLKFSFWEGELYVDARARRPAAMVVHSVECCVEPSGGVIR